MAKEKSSSEIPGGFMFTERYALFVANMSDEESGRILKGLIHAFWGYGKAIEQSDDPLRAALFDSILQSAQEINANYQKQLEQKRNAGLKSAEARSEKANGVQAAFNTAEQCSNGVELNKNINENINENINLNSNSEIEDFTPSLTDSSPPPKKKKPVYHVYGEFQHVKLTDEQRQKLIESYGEQKIDEYIKRVDEYVQQHGKKYNDYHLTIKNWIERDKEKSTERQQDNSNSRYSMDDFLGKSAQNNLTQKTEEQKYYDLFFGGKKP